MADSYSSADRRRSQRVPMAVAVQFFHGPTQREFPARSVDVSEGGMLMYVPAGAPVAAGQAVRVCVSAPTRPEFAGLAGKDITATIVHVDRQKMLVAGHLPVGIRFEES